MQAVQHYPSQQHVVIHDLLTTWSTVRLHSFLEKMGEYCHRNYNRTACIERILDLLTRKSFVVADTNYNNYNNYNNLNHSLQRKRSLQEMQQTDIPNHTPSLNEELGCKVNWPREQLPNNCTRFVVLPPSVSNARIIVSPLSSSVMTLSNKDIMTVTPNVATINTVLDGQNKLIYGISESFRTWQRARVLRNGIDARVVFHSDYDDMSKCLCALRNLKSSRKLTIIVPGEQKKLLDLRPSISRFISQLEYAHKKQYHLISMVTWMMISIKYYHTLNQCPTSTMIHQLVKEVTKNLAGKETSSTLQSTTGTLSRMRGITKTKRFPPNSDKKFINEYKIECYFIDCMAAMFIQSLPYLQNKILSQLTTSDVFQQQQQQHPLANEITFTTIHNALHCPLDMLDVNLFGGFTNVDNPYQIMPKVVFAA